MDGAEQDGTEESTEPGRGAAIIAMAMAYDKLKAEAGSRNVT